MSAVAMTVNGKAVTGDVDPRTLLVQFLREHLRLTGTHVGCDTSQCGACVVHVNGKAVKSCTVFCLADRGRRCPHHRRGSPSRAGRCIRCRRPSASIMGCNAAIAPPV